MGEIYLIHAVRRDATGAITRVAWSRRKPYSVCVETDVADVIVALRDGAQVKVAVGHIVFGGVQASADGTTIVDQDGDPQPFRLADVPLLSKRHLGSTHANRPPFGSVPSGVHTPGPSITSTEGPVRLTVGAR